MGAGYRHYNPIMENMNVQAASGYGERFLKLLKYAAVGSTVQLVSNTEASTDWDASSATFDLTDETTDKRVDGSNCLELVDDTSATGGFASLDKDHRPNGEDWDWAGWICMWIHDDTGARTAGELTFQIRNNGTWSAETAVPTLAAADFYELRCIDITGLARGNVDGFRFVDNRITGTDEKVYIDNIFITDLITGIGDATAIGTGPVRGPVISLPVQTGSTIVYGDMVEWGVMGVATGTANDTRIIGIACQDKDSSGTSVVASDTVPAEVLVAIAPSIIYLRNDASGMAEGAYGLLGTDVVTAAPGSGTANAEYGFCISLENSATTEWASGDSAYQIVPQGFEAA